VKVQPSIDRRPLDRVLIVGNPTAGARHRANELRELQDSLSAQGLIAEVVTDLESLGPLAESLEAAGRLRVVIAAGGDGTVAEVVNRTSPTTPITVYPLGTANLLAGYFAIRRNPQAMARLISEGTLVRLDAGRAGGRIFVLMISCGFDADVVARLHRRRRGGHISYWTWARPILESIRSYRYPDLRVYCQAPAQPEVELSHAARWAFAVNMPVYAGGLLVSPDARADDALFDVCTFRRGSLWHALNYVGNVFLRRHQRLADYRCLTATRIRIEADEPVPYQLDGDPGGLLPVEIEMLPGRLTLLVPAARARALGLPTAAPESQGV
jgi:diacylglycerol kinase (ATP)